MSLVTPERAITLLQEGAVVAVPTETVYGLAGRIDDERALRQIFAIKKRPFFDPLIVHVADVAAARDLAREWPPIYEELARRFWPGPLTLVAPKRPHVSDLITSGLDSVGLRCPRHPVALAILNGLGVPFAAPSANLFGRTSPTRAADVLAELSVPVVDGGDSEVGVESTVVKWDGSRLHLLRPGLITRERLREVGVEVVRTQSQASPGHLEVHYQPRNPVVLVEGDTPFARAELGPVFELRLPSEPALAARVLYSEFRRLSEEPGAILVRRVTSQTGEEWEVIWDRIERAASYRV